MMRTARICDWSSGAWNFAFLSEVFVPDFYRELEEGLPTIDWREASKSFYTQREANLATNEHYRATLNPTRLADIRELAEDFFGCKLDAKIEVAAHKLVRGDRIGIHTDRNTLGETHRLTLHLNERWRAEDGGVLLALRERDPASATNAWLPRSNTAFLFEIGSRSFHAVTAVEGEAPRYSIVFTFRAKNPESDALTPLPSCLPFPTLADLAAAAESCARQGIDAAALDDAFRYATRNEVRAMTAECDGEGGARSVGAGAVRCRFAPPIAVSRRDGRLVLVSGAQRLARGFDGRVVVFEEAPAQA